MTVKLFVAFILLYASVCCQIPKDFLKRNGLSKEDFNYVQRKTIELNNLLGKSLGIPRAPLSDQGNQDTLAVDEDQVFYNREQIDFLIKHYENQERRGTKKTTGKRNDGRKKRMIVDFDKYPSERWEFPIPYTIESTFAGKKKQLILDAVAHWEEHTCIRFKKIGDEYTNSTKHYIHFYNGGSCATKLGSSNKTSPQLIYANECDKIGNFIHEIGHAVGLIHQQSREDRDKFVKINGKNIRGRKMQNVNFAVTSFTRTYNSPYDVGSIMHYSGYAIGLKANQPTITSKNPFLQKAMGQRAALSFYDKKVANLEYCDDKCRARPCRRGGFPDPNDCSKCVCPDGFGGSLCKDVAPSSPKCPDKTPEIFLDDTTERCTEYTASAGDAYQCNLMIYTRKNWKIHFHNQTVDINGCGDDNDVKSSGPGTYCCESWGEIKHDHDLQTTGPRYCGRDKKRDKIVSESNEVMIVLKIKDSSKKPFKFCYSAAPTCKDTWKGQRNKHFNGGIGLDAKSLEACQKKCISHDLTCYAVDWNPKRKSLNCWIHLGPAVKTASLISKNGVTHYKRSDECQVTCKTNWNGHRNKHYTGGIADDANKLEACQKNCISHVPTCFAVDWNPRKKIKCWLHTNPAVRTASLIPRKRTTHYKRCLE